MSLTLSQAKLIPLKDLVEKLGGRYSHTDRKGEHWYHSPFRPEEKTASFKINEKNNTWHDFGLSNTFAHQKQGSGGDTVDLWCDYHFKDRRFGIPDAIKAFEQFGFISANSKEQPFIPRKEKSTYQIEQPRYKIVKVADRITYNGLKDELNRRRINLKLAERYLKQGHIQDNVSGKEYTCFLFENDKGGFEVSIPNKSRNDCFKTCFGTKASTRLMASDKQHKADIFEGFFDFLAWLEMKGYQQHVNHTYILNSVSLINEVCTKIIAFSEVITDVFLFMDNDDAGVKATHAIAENLTNEEMFVGSCEHIYDGSKDLSEYWAQLKPTEKPRF